MQTESAVVTNAAAQEAFASEITGTPAPTQFEQVVNNQVIEQKGYTEEDIKKVREQEKSKLYPQIDSLKEELNALKKERDERLAEAEKLRLEQEADTRKKVESEMDIRQLLEAKEIEWEDKLGVEKAERERAFVLLDRERQYAELNEFRTRRLEEERDNIIPELVDLISGGTTEEIENSITGLRDRSSKILESAQLAMQNARRDMTGS